MNPFVEICRLGELGAGRCADCSDGVMRVAETTWKIRDMDFLIDWKP